MHWHEKRRPVSLSRTMRLKPPAAVRRVAAPGVMRGATMLRRSVGGPKRYGDRARGGVGIISRDALASIANQLMASAAEIVMI